ncbi:MAG: hypothetical protein NTY15_05195 [Planctomycetota bacterium]|nr:hypothetical protein [Planctomycetota bacterium]
MKIINAVANRFCISQPGGGISQRLCDAMFTKVGGNQLRVLW